LSARDRISDRETTESLPEAADAEKERVSEEDEEEAEDDAVAATRFDSVGDVDNKGKVEEEDEEEEVEEETVGSGSMGRTSWSRRSSGASECRVSLDSAVSVPADCLCSGMARSTCARSAAGSGLNGRSVREASPSSSSDEQTGNTSRST